MFGFSGKGDPQPALFTHVEPKSGQEALVATTNADDTIGINQLLNVMCRD